VSEASEITRRAKSNLAFALRVLPQERRDDAVVFYAFCRTVDDLADTPGPPVDERRAALEEWRDGLLHGFRKPDDFRREVVALKDRHAIPEGLLAAVVEGCLMDLEPRVYETWDELGEYIWKVACAVGLVSIRLFGCTHAASEDYAVALGRALQLTNILRDVGEDHANGRIYLPREEIAAHGLVAGGLRDARSDRRFGALMAAVAERADGYFEQAARVLPPEDRAALLPARVMAEIYQTLLGRMRRDGFRVFDKRYRLSTARKLAILSKHLIASRSVPE
jgi:phytoene synthase